MGMGMSGRFPTEEQLGMEVAVHVTPYQKKLVDTAMDLHVRAIYGDFKPVADHLLEEYGNVKDGGAGIKDIDEICFLFDCLQRIYFQNITWRDMEKHMRLVKLHNLREDIKIQKRDFRCSAGDLLDISNTYLEFYNRMLQGQIHHIDMMMRMLWWEKFENYNYELVQSVIARIKRVLFNFQPNEAYGVGNRNCRKFNETYEIIKWMQSEIYEKFRPDDETALEKMRSPYILRVTKQKPVEVEFMDTIK
jgi:hypothetical protein